MSETELWSNPSPNTGADQITASLNQSLQNFTYIKIYIKASTTDTTESNTIFEVSQVVQMTDGSDRSKPRGMVGMYSTGNRARRLIYLSNTSLRLDYPDSITRVIPTKITGMK